jgi:hypothetical protein
MDCRDPVAKEGRRVTGDLTALAGIGSVLVLSWILAYFARRMGGR